MTEKELLAYFVDLAPRLRKMPMVTHVQHEDVGWDLDDPVADAISVASRELTDEEYFKKRWKPEAITLSKRLIATMAWRLGYFADDCEPPRMRSFYRLVARARVVKKPLLVKGTPVDTFLIRDGDDKVVGRGDSRQQAWQAAMRVFFKRHGADYFQRLYDDMSVWRIRSVLDETRAIPQGKGGSKKPVAKTPGRRGK